ncbi:CmpA/NrtA family ABC transporter substrate-binding protein [Jannaschia sp. M317]|uniref:CmpA/NrtA family ABC transporter substrate-binding protein n=1 Tax=Jannaschia sp. M317 TaxID=2867011 RepID=UPI0021A6B046|nr:CmpA/NrtA family ABC transporter substrate-binding protein [Jannaschia sp. M317]UWQ17440.1 ABC transporter substrate-binding protein [Jannaschia sp. M317]
MTGQVLNIGYVPLVDCAPLVIARELGFAAEEGLSLSLMPQPSWSALRDMLVLGHLDAAQMLSPMPVAMSMGLGGLSAQVDALMVLAVNGTVFGVSRALAARMRDRGAVFGDVSAVASALAPEARVRIGVPFPYSMHRLLLDYFLERAPALQGAAIEVVTVPPRRMADAMERGELDALWVGEPWGSDAVLRGVAELWLPGQAIWAFSPEKVLAMRHDRIQAAPGTTRALMRAVYHACRWLDAPRNKPLAIEILARSEHLDLSDQTIDPAITGRLTPAQGASPVEVPQFQLFHRHTANFPWRSQANWIAERLGADAEARALARASFRSDLYREVLGPLGADLPGASEKIEGAMRHATAVASTKGHMILGPDAFFDGETFDPTPES